LNWMHPKWKANSWSQGQCQILIINKNINKNMIFQQIKSIGLCGNLNGSYGSL